MEHKKQKRKGGAEKLRDKKKKSLEEFAEKKKKKTDLFGSRSGVPNLAIACTNSSSFSSGEPQQPPDLIKRAPECSRAESDSDTAEHKTEPSVTRDIVMVSYVLYLAKMLIWLMWINLLLLFTW